MEFSELILKRRSIRKYTDQPVGLDLLEEIIRKSAYAPSAGNGQPWKFIIIQQMSLLETISKECKVYLLNRLDNNPNDPAKRYTKLLQRPGFDILYHSPCLVYIIGHQDVKNVVEDCTLAACYFMMAATDAGLGTCWINFAREVHKEKTRSLIGIPEDHTIVAPIIVGYPAKTPRIPARDDEVVLKIVA